jgi:hypothetical protein
MAKRVLQKHRLEEVSAVDAAANPYAKVVLMKRHGESTAMTPATAYETLMKRAREMSERVAKSGTGQTLTVESAFAKIVEDAANRDLFALACAPGSAPARIDDTPQTQVPAAFEKLMKRARKLAASDPTRTVEQHFEKLCEDPANAGLLAKAKRPVAGAKPKQGKPNVDPNDDDDLDGEDADDDVDDGTDDGHDGIGARPFEGASGSGRGRSTDYSGAPYVDGDNTWQTPRPAVMGRTEGSYNPQARPASARRSFSAKVEKRVAKYMARNPGASRSDALAYATAGKKVQRLPRLAGGELIRLTP